MNEFEPQEQAPTDIYEYDKATKKAPSRMQAAFVATAGFVIFGGLVGGGAFAMTGGLSGILPGASSAPSSAANDPASGSSDSNSAVDPSASSSDSNVAVDPSATPSDSNAAVDPATPSDSNAAVDPATPATPAPTDTQIVVPPVFNPNGDDENEGSGDDGAKPRKHHSGKHSTSTPSATPTGAPTFGSGDDEGDGGD